MARLNVQGLARQDKRLMSALKAPLGYSYVSCDLGSGEPTCTAHFSKDRNYYDATFGMVGKAPFYDGKLLKIDDIYLTSASFSPMAADKMREAFNSRYGTLTFAEQWLTNKEVITKDAGIAPLRKFHKPLVLGIGYCMGPKKLVTTAYDNGYILGFKQAKTFHENYWTTYSAVWKLNKLLEAKYNRDKRLLNPFGYALYPDKPYKSFNYFIQSSVSGIMHVIRAKFAAITPYAQFITIIHDELIYLIPTEKLAEAKDRMKAVEVSLNNDLKWTVNIRIGWTPGKDMYEAH